MVEEHANGLTLRKRRFDPGVGGDPPGVEEEELSGVALILHAIDLTIAQVEERVDDPDRDETLGLLREMRRRWEAQAGGE